MFELVDSKLIVTDPTDAFYIHYPDPPIGLVFLNYDEGTNKITKANTMVPASAWTAVFLCRYGTKAAITKAMQIADNLIDNIIATTVNDKAMYFQSVHYYNSTAEQWQRRKDDGYCEVYIRDLMLSAYALTCVFMRCGKSQYKEYALKLIEGIYKQQSAFSALCGTELPEYLDGAFPEFYLRNDVGESFYAVNWRVPLHLGDIAYDMSKLAISAFGNRQETAEGEVFYIGDINDRYHSFVRNNCILNQRGIMQSTGLPYMYMAPVEGTSDFTGENLSPVYNQWGDVNWTSDTIMWAVLGIAKNEGEGARTFCDKVKAIMKDGFLYDVYTYEGQRDNEFIDIATQATIFYLEALRAVED